MLSQSNYVGFYSGACYHRQICVTCSLASSVTRLPRLNSGSAFSSRLDTVAQRLNGSAFTLQKTSRLSQAAHPHRLHTRARMIKIFYLAAAFWAIIYYIYPQKASTIDSRSLATECRFVGTRDSLLDMTTGSIHARYLRNLYLSVEVINENFEIAAPRWDYRDHYRTRKTFS